MTAFCVECHGSGERDMQGFLDCQAPGCTAATERAALDTHLLALGRLHERDLVWEAYKLGQAKAPAPDLGKLKRWAEAPYQCGGSCYGGDMGGVKTDPEGEYIKLADVLALFAAPANNNTEKADDR